MDRSSGNSDIIVGLIDGPVMMHSDFSKARWREIALNPPANCSKSSSLACAHGTAVASILFATRASATPGVCPGCSTVVRSIFREFSAKREPLPTATPEELSVAIVDCVQAGARVINMSVGLAQTSMRSERMLNEALDFAAKRGVIPVVAAGNQSTLGSTALIRHPWVIPVAACNPDGTPSLESNLGNSIGRRGLMAPGENLRSAGSEGKPYFFRGTSAAAPLVTGTVALLWSEYPSSEASTVRTAMMHQKGIRRNMVTPPLLDAWAAYNSLRGAATRG